MRRSWPLLRRSSLENSHRFVSYCFDSIPSLIQSACLLLCAYNSRYTTRSTHLLDRMPELQTIPARHGVATFVPAGQVIKIVNTSGTQVIDTWAFALPKPEAKKGEAGSKDENEKSEQNAAPKQEEAKQEDSSKTEDKPKPTPKKKKGNNDLPSQEEAEKATREGLAKGEEESKDGTVAPKSTWSSYVPSIGWSSKKDGDKQGAKDQTQQQKDSKTWSSYFPSGQGFSNYIPKTASNTVSSFTSSVKPTYDPHSWRDD
jgi:hypothetical protein